ncbi:hypothetical protein [Pseudomonas sp. Marseille-QA0892]
MNRPIQPHVETEPGSLPETAHHVSARRGIATPADPLEKLELPIMTPEADDAPASGDLPL